jgi:tetratricopeptide (TPR) repeat protein
MSQPNTSSDSHLTDRTRGDEPPPEPAAAPDSQSPTALTGHDTPIPRPAPDPAVDVGLPAIAGYDLLGPLGQGGMGLVLKGRDALLQRDLAVKVLRPDQQHDPGTVRRFVEEAQIGGQLQHPGIAPVYALGHFADGRPFFTMKLVKGQTLAQLLQQRTNPSQELPRFLGIFQQVCQTLAYAHSKGVIHRDLKPQNVMVGAFGEVQVMDWGLAKVLSGGGSEEQPGPGLMPPEGVPSAVRTIRTDQSGATSQDGAVLGTPAYMAPEQARGQVDRLDRRTDVFGLGAILCEILTGRPPYVAEAGWQVYQKAMAGDLAPALARLQASGADADLLSLAGRCLAADPVERPADAGKMAAEVTAYQDAVAERLRRAEVERAQAQVTAREERRRRKLTLALAAAVLGLVVVGAGAGLWLERQAARQEAELRQGVEAALDKAGELQKQARWGEAQAVLEQARDRLEQDGPADLRRRVQQALTDVDLVRRLDAARLKAATWVGGRFDQAGAAREYAAAFRQARLGQVGDDVAVVAARLRRSAVKAQLVAALDDWASCTFSASRRSWLLAVARRADPDRWRDRFRDPKLWQDRQALERLARPAPLRRWSPQLVTALARVLRDRGGDAVPLLTAAQARHPQDFWLNFHLGDALQEAKRPEAAIGYYRAALALRPNTSAVYFMLGTALYGKGQLDEAIACFQKAMALDPKDAKAHNNLGNALKAKGQLDRAIACYEKALALDPKDAKAHNNLGNALKAKGQLDRAIACYAKALALDPKDAKAHTNLGNALYTQGQRDRAIACWKKALDLDPKLAPAHANLGLALRDKGQLDRAIACYEKALAIDPKDALAHYNLGDALHAQGQLDRAIACYEKALDLDPKDAYAHNNLGLALADKGQQDRAIACYRQALALNPKNARAHTNLGNALQAKGQLDRAIACYEKALALDPKLAKAHTNLGVALYAQGQWAQAIACHRKALALDPKDAEAHTNLGVVLDAQGQRDRAIACYQKALALDPKLAKAHNNLGVALAAKGELDRAIACYAKALAINPKLAPAHANLGNALYTQGQRDRAIACWKKALALDPKDAQPHHNLGLALHDKGELDQAITCYRKALVINPNYATAHYNLGQALHDKGQRDGAIACYQKALAINPKFAKAHTNLGLALYDKGERDRAIACYEKALALDPKLAPAHYNLGNALYDKGELDRAIACYQKALVINPKLVRAHFNLGNALKAKGQLDRAIACYEKALALDPKDAKAHYNLGKALKDKGRLDEAIVAYRRAIALQPKFAEAHCNLGHAFRDKGAFRAALAALQRGHQLGTQQPRWRYPSAQWVKEAERWVQLDQQLPALLKGQAKAAGAAELLEYARLCILKKFYQASARFWADAFTADPKRAGDLGSWNRYNAACSAALAAAGQGQDAGQLTGPERARLRRQAVAWLRADLALWTRVLASGQAQARVAVQQQLQHWQRDTDLAGIRDAAWLVNLPADELRACRRLWAEVDALLKRASSPK